MERLEVQGGQPLNGTVKISGAKNEALKVIALGVLIRGKFVVRNVPDISDIRSQLKIFEYLGGTYKFSNNGLELDGREISLANLDTDVTKALRASIVYLGPLLARFREVELPFPGGCAIGRRPIDTHLKAFEDLGARIERHGENYKIYFDGFRAKKIKLAEPSVTATENMLMFLSNFEENFEISGCAIEPEITDLVSILNKAGAEISQTDERIFAIKGNQNLLLDEVDIIPDRIEAFSYLIGFLITGGEGKIENFPAKFMEKPLQVLNESGVKFELNEDVLTVHKSDEIKPFSVETAPYPGFPTDMQSPLSLIGIIARGKSTINETMFENRLGYLDELKKMGFAAEVINSHEAEITGPAKLQGATISALDLRSGITLVLAALAASGKSTIENGQLIDRGYEDLIGKLTRLGANIEAL